MFNKYIDFVFCLFFDVFGLWDLFFFYFVERCLVCFLVIRIDLLGRFYLRLRYLGYSISLCLD